MRIFKSPFFWFTLIICLLLYGCLAPLFSLKRHSFKYVEQSNLIYLIRTENTDDKTGTVFVSCNPKNPPENALIIPATITDVGVTYSVIRIGAWAFDHCTNLTSVSIPSGVTQIDMEAFNHCEKLKSIEVDKENQNFVDVDGVLFSKDMSLLVTYPAGKKGEKYTIPDSVTRIEEHAFAGCSLTDITIPNSVTQIGAFAFEKCKNLANITIPDSVSSIDEWAFAHCTCLTNLIIGNGVTRINGYAFGSCEKLTSITIPDSVTHIGGWSFASCTNLTNLIIGKNVTHIDSSAFSFCKNLTSVNLPNRITHIGNFAFSDCSLTNITIPDSVKYIGRGAFKDCTNLKAIYFKGAPPNMEDESLEKNLVLYYVEGTRRWKTPTWRGYTTETWTPEP